MGNKWSAIECFEMHDTRKEWFDSDGRFRASVKLMCDWNDRFKLVQDLYTSTLGASTRVTGRAYSPREYPHDNTGQVDVNGIDAPLMSTIGVISANISTMPEAYTAETGSYVMKYKTTAYVDVQYGRHYDIEETLEYDTEVITQSYKDFKWKTALNANDLRLVKELEVPMAILQHAILVRDFVGLAPENYGPEGNTFLKPDFSTLVDLVGKTNTSAYTSAQLGKTFKEGTLLMLEPEVRPAMDMQNIHPSTGINFFGSDGKSVRVKFLYKKGGTEQGHDTDTHNLFYRPRGKSNTGSPINRGGWDRLTINIEEHAEEDYAFFQPDQLIDAHWLIEAVTPYAAT